MSGIMRLLVVGCGGIGGVLAAHLFEQGQDVTALTTNTLIADAINGFGFRVRGEQSPGTVPGRAVCELSQGTAPFDFVLLATQPPQVEEAARSALPFLAPGGAMVCLQNGLCEERIAAIAGAERVLGAIVTWGASMVEPGVYDRTSAGGFVLGRMDGAADPRLEALSFALEAVGPTSITENLAGARWSKLAINCAISSLGTVGGDRLGVLMRHRFVRRMALEIMTEAVEVARANAVRLEKVSGTVDLDWIALTDADRQATAGSPSLFAKHALLLAVGARYRRLRSSMLAAIERGRPPAVDFLNGEIVTRGAQLGLATPMNAAARDQVLAIAARKARPSLDLLRQLWSRTRAPGAVAPAAQPVLSPPRDIGAAPPAGGVPRAADAPIPDAAAPPAEVAATQPDAPSEPPQAVPPPPEAGPAPPGAGVRPPDAGTP
jgi:2-dehydropantoate 2-reductase